MNCSLCNFSHENLKRFSDHVKSEHNISSEEYTILVDHNNVRPICKVCSNPVRYVSYSFKTYCKDHARLAMKLGGCKGGVAEAWNKGKTKDTDERIKTQAVKATGEGNPFFGKRHSTETKLKIASTKTLALSSIEERINIRQHEFRLITTVDQYMSRQEQYLMFQCVVCNEVQPKTLQAFERGSRCYRCEPLGKSNWELDVYDYVKYFAPDAISGDRRAISPKEIDVYVPSKKFGVECHGLYWHSESAKEHFDKNKHFEKAQRASEQHVKLLQIFEDEWRDKRNICESLILHRLGVTPNKIGARSTTLIELTTEEQRRFFDEAHISGYTQAKISWGLKNKEGLIVAAISLRAPRHGKRYTGCMEIARYSCTSKTIVVGGLSKLMKHAMLWCRNNGYKKIMTYVDKRIGFGVGYERAGFKTMGSTSVDYWYTDNCLRYDRFKFRATKDKPEKQVASDAKVSKIYGCGSLIMMYDIDLIYDI